MSKISITTSHNIVLNMPLATVGQRIGATLIDFVLVSILYGILSFAFGSSPTILLFITIPLFFLYHLTCEIFNRGQSLGKKMLKIRVVALDGKEVSLMSFIIRWAFRLVDIGMGIGSVAIAVIYGSHRGQRIGDILAGTTVIQINNTEQVFLKDLEKYLNINHQVQYPQVKTYSDTEMLLLKDVLVRYRKTPNEANRAILTALTKKYKEELSITEQVPPLDFLTSVLEDYIILTR